MSHTGRASGNNTHGPAAIPVLGDLFSVICFQYRKPQERFQ